MMGEELKKRGVSRLVGVDIIPDAYEAVIRDRPGLYDAYYVEDFTRLNEDRREDIASWQFNCMVTVAALLNVYRLIKGPDAPDRVLALDTLYINAIALIILLGLTLGTRMYLEAALLIAVMGFVGTVAMAKYLKRGSVIE